MGWTLFFAAALTFGSEPGQLPQPPPATRPAPGDIHAVPAQVRLQTERIELENSHLLAVLEVKPRLKLVRLFNKHSASECLTSGQSSHLFAVSVDNRLLPSDRFDVVGVSHELAPPSASLTLKLQAESVGGELTVLLDNSWRMRWSLKIVNGDAQPHTIRIFWVLNHISVGSEVDKNYYFYPFKGGWTSNVPFHLGHGYGTPTGSLQVVSVFNPCLGGGVYAWTADDSGAMKTLWLRKVQEKDVSPPCYESLRDFMGGGLSQSAGLPLDLAPGVSLAISPLPLAVAAQQPAVVPDLVVGVHPGDWRQALEDYANWVRTWWRPPQVPSWLRRSFNIPSVHNDASVRQRRYCTIEELSPSYHLLQWAFWWESPSVDRFNHAKADAWYRYAFGDYGYETRWGGLEALHGEVERVHKNGIRVALLVQNYLVWKHSQLAGQHAHDWAARNPSGQPLSDWSGEETGMDVWDFCVGHAPYQDHVSEVCRRVLRETGADGIYLDSAADAYPCADDRHRHGNETGRFSLGMLRKVRAAIKQANPEAILHIEDVCSEHHLQFIDGAWLKEFETYPPMSAYTPLFDVYPIYFLRFYFPEVWFADWGAGDNAVGWRRTFFNGIGISRGRSDYTDRTGRVMRENAEAFASLRPEPLVRTEKEGVFANRFPAKTKTIYTIYNRTQRSVSGPLLRVPQEDGRHYVELLSRQEVGFEAKGDQALLSCEIPAGEVLAIGQLPKALAAQRSGGPASPRVRVQILGHLPGQRVVVLAGHDPNDPGRPVPLQDGSAEIDLAPFQAVGGPIALALFSGDELVDQLPVGLGQEAHAK